MHLKLDMRCQGIGNYLYFVGVIYFVELGQRGGNMNICLCILYSFQAFIDLINDICPLKLNLRPAKQDVGHC